MQEDKVTLPFEFITTELKFDADGVATITSESKLDAAWHIKCLPKKVSWMSSASVYSNVL